MSSLSIPLRLALLLLILSPPSLAAWDERSFGDREYVSLGSVRKYYGFREYQRRGKDLRLENTRVEMTLRIGSHECVMNGVKFVFSYPVRAAADQAWISKIDLMKLVHPVLRPNIIETAGNFRTVILDPGHGGKDPGATNHLGTEADYNLLVARQVRDILQQRYRFRVVMTRDDDRFLSLQQRVALANGIRDDAVFISIHHNAGRSAARGIETFTLSPVGVSHYGRGLKPSDFSPKTGNHCDSANVALATAIHGTLLTTLCDGKSGKAYTIDRGIKRARFSVLSGVRHPSVLVECGFMSHPSEARLIHHPDYQRTVAKSIAYAITKYRAAVGGSRRPPTAAAPARGRMQTQ